MVEKLEERHHLAELHRLRAVFLASMGADETQIEASFLEAIAIAKSHFRGHRFSPVDCSTSHRIPAHCCVEQ